MVCDHLHCIAHSTIARKCDRKALIPNPPDPDLSALLSAYPDTDCYDEGETDRYVMGYSLVPPEMMANFSAFAPWDAFDCAHKRGVAQGILAARATLNANGRLQVVSVHDLIGPECSLTCGAAFGAEKHCLANSPSALDGESP